MNERELGSLLNQLITMWENEVVEFKQAGAGFSTTDIGHYFSALANEANLRNCECAWLVFGVHNRTRQIVGTDFRPDSENLQKLKMQITDGIEPSITFRNIYELKNENGRVLFFEIPPAPRGIPISWNGHYYARAGESLVSLGLGKLDEIRNQTRTMDWSAQVLQDATVDHFDIDAVKKARESFALKYANRFSSQEVSQWPLLTFLDRARLTRDGKITRTALLLLGKKEASHLLLPYPAEITWKLEGHERAYEHFGPPFLIATTAVYQKIRNIQVRILPEVELVPVEVAKYNQKVLLEALHNCIAHQNYNRNGRVIVTELPDKLTFENEGNFFEGQPSDYFTGHKTPRRYRNPFLVHAMTELNMIDTMGYGIHEMHMEQAARYFPMPDYDLSNQAVKITIYGSVVDPAYSQLLMRHTDLSIEDIVALDRIQKKLPVDEESLKHLRREQLVEGRKPNLHISAKVADITEKKAEYILTRSLDDEFYTKLIVDYLKEFGSISRKEIDALLMNKLSDGLNNESKETKINNLLTNLRRGGIIKNTGSRKTPCWVLAEK